MFRFRLLGVPYEIELSFWLGSAVFGSNLARGEHALLLLATWVLCVFVSIVLHELGHALAARQCGAKPWVMLYAMGGLTSFGGERFTRPQYLGIVLAGPLAGFAAYCLVGVGAPYGLAALAAGGWLDRFPTLDLALSHAADFLIYINLWWTLFNLLPICPLDGGQALRTVLSPQRVGWSRGISVVCAAVLCVMALEQGRWFLALFAAYLAYQNFVGEARTLPGAGGRV